MAFVGNLSGPKKSEIVSRLGHAFFGLSPEEFRIEVELYRDDEQLGETVDVNGIRIRQPIVDPVHIDDNGRPYIEFLRGARIVRFYLEDHGYRLDGEIRTYTEPEALRWRIRQAGLANS